ncbi:MAG: flagellar basal body P-ring formation chaperone FlgA, partial [Thermoguttaceae bacterium]
MPRFSTILVLLLAIVVGRHAACCQAVEIRLRAECTPVRPIVTLGELADLHCDSASQAERLARIPLFPSPAPGLQRFVAVREIQDMLLIRGINLIDHEFVGSPAVRVVGLATPAPPAAERQPPPASPRLAEQKLRKALHEYLLRSADEPWQIDFQLDEQANRWIVAAQSLTVGGAGVPSPGRYCFEVALQVDGAAKTIDVVAQLDLPPLVVVPVRAIARDTRIDEADVQLKRLDPSAETAGCAQRIEDLVGKETTRVLAPGKPIPRSCVREPVMVRRGDVVTVFVRTAGIRVRTQARAQDDGARGELVSVESLADRRTFFAQVSG